ncbi:YbhB/YbcL family Raf kinase inhibitor-like protein [Sphingomonas sp. CLY1604]|uniref:YbhB/YbcL family Raf kinase inhibitor-like protein n=1 Tax=Sphingomonas sp. CLY1604 TaxID=3457786 RepID=UPI003FD7DDB8
MLEHLPAWLGRALGDVRAGMDGLGIVRLGLDTGLPALGLSSPAFADGARLPERFTADGEGVSPPLLWTAPPAGTARLALLVEDADAPAPQPLVHAIVWGMTPGELRLTEGAIVGDGAGTPEGDVGRNSYFREGWLPPDPPTGHGTHRYAFQLFALDGEAGDPGETPGRAAVLEAMAGHVLAAGVLIGTYSRGEDAPVGPVGAAQTA